MRPKFLFLTCLFMLIFAALPAQQAKRVYITLDVSGSMTGNKYSLANYTTQMIVTLCDEDDEVNMIVYGVKKCLSDVNNPLGVIQMPMNDIKFGQPTGGSQFDDIIAFNEIYKLSEVKQDWLFIIGDGIWGTLISNTESLNPYYEPGLLKFKDIVENGSLNICYLQTGHTLAENNDFTRFASTLGIVDIGKSDVNSKSIKEGCDHFARKILGFSDVPLKVKKAGSQCIRINAEIPLKAFYLVYQDETTPNDLPKIENIIADGQSLSHKLKGTPTTIPTKSNEDVVDLSGNVWYVTSNGTIPGNTEIEVCFDKKINPDNICIYPLVENVGFGSSCLTIKGGKLKRLDSKSFTICRDEQTALVRIELDDASASNLPEGLLKSTTVIVKANNKEYKAKYNNGGFECEIELIGQETQYFAECDCPGYFKRVTPITTIVKGDCLPEFPPEMPVKEMPTADLGTMTFGQLKDNNIHIWIQDTLSNEVLNPELFDIDIEIENPFLYEDPDMQLENDTMILAIRPKGEWCECLFPETLKIRVVSTPKEEAYIEYGKSYNRTEYPINIHIVKDRPWLMRCLWVLIAMAALLVFIFYLRGLLKKNRFKKTARIENSYIEDETSRKETRKKGRLLREPGIGPWINRWFNPFVDEKRSMSFSRPKTKTLTFIASESKERIFLAKGCYDERTMNMANYVPQPEGSGRKQEDIKMTAGEQIEIMNMHKMRLGHLTFTTERKDDESGYRVFVGVLMTLSIAAFLALLWMMLRGVW